MKGDYAMSIQLVKETVISASALQAAPQQTTVEAEVMLPGGLRDEVRVLYTDARAVPQVCEASAGRVTVSGRVDFFALYAQGDLTRVKAAQVSHDFSRALNAQETADYTPVCEVSQVQSRVFNGRLLLRADLNIYASALSNQEESVVASVSEADVQTLEKEICTQIVVGSGAEQGLIREEVEISDVLGAQEALLSQAEARVEDIIGGADGRATVTGSIDLTACFASSLPGRPVVYSQHSLPFEQTVTLGGEMGDMLSASAEVTDTAVALEGDESGAVLRAEVGLHVKLAAIREQEVHLVTDAFATDSGTVSEGKVLSFCTEMINEQTAESARVQLMLPENAPRIKTVLCAFARPVLAGASEQGGRLTVDMSLCTTLLYMTEDSGIPVSYTAEEPLRLHFAGSARAEDMLSLSASHVEASMVSGDRAEVRCVITLHADGERYEQVFALGSMERDDLAAHGSELALYITQPGERLWDVMKRYRLNEEKIKALNEPVKECAVDAPLPLATRLIAYRR